LAERFYRARSRGVIGGVAAGLADYFDVHPVWMRLVFILAALAANVSVVVYVILWLVLPEESEMVALPRVRILEHNVRQVQSEAQQWAQYLVRVFDRDTALGNRETKRALLLGGLLILLGLATLADSVELLGPFRLDHLWPAVLILIGSFAFHRALRIH
jgi:phage shock protein C